MGREWYTSDVIELYFVFLILIFSLIFWIFQGVQCGGDGVLSVVVHWKMKLLIRMEWAFCHPRRIQVFGSRYGTIPPPNATEKFHRRHALVEMISTCYALRKQLRERMDFVCNYGSQEVKFRIDLEERSRIMNPDITSILIYRRLYIVLNVLIYDLCLRRITL